MPFYKRKTVFSWITRATIKFLCGQFLQQEIRQRTHYHRMKVGNQVTSKQLDYYEATPHWKPVTPQSYVALGQLGQDKPA